MSRATVDQPSSRFPRPGQPELIRLLRDEFRGYNATTARRDLIAGLTVAAVALPLALAFGVASGATPAAGLVTAIIAGLVIGLLSGAPYQISGPTGAMSAVLIVIAGQHGPRGLWIAGLMSAAIILFIGILRLGRLVNLIPAPVITGFTSGIAAVIFIGQIDNFLGIKTPAHDRSLQKLFGYFTTSLPPINWSAVLCGAIVIAVMVGLPRFVTIPGLPTALIGITLATVVAWAAKLDVHTIGAIPRGIVLSDRYVPSRDDLHLMGQLIGPAIAIALLGSIESLLCGVVAGRMTGQKLAVNQELIAQGIGNLVIPFAGGVPATAAIARTSVGVKAGGATRMVSIIHALTLLLGSLFLASLIGKIPLAALAGVLFVTAWRMNEWHAIHYYRHHRLYLETGIFALTMLATVALDLTQAIVVGIAASLVLFLWKVARLDVSIAPVEWERLDLDPAGKPVASVVYVSGPLFFASVNQLVERIESAPFAQTLILSMRGVPMADVSSVQALEHLWREHVAKGGTLYLVSLQPQVEQTFERVGLVAAMGEGQFVWSADTAIRQLAAQGVTPPPVATSEAELDEDERAFDDMPLGLTATTQA